MYFNLFFSFRVLRRESSYLFNSTIQATEVNRVEIGGCCLLEEDLEIYKRTCLLSKTNPGMEWNGKER